MGTFYCLYHSTCLRSLHECLILAIVDYCRCAYFGLSARLSVARLFWELYSEQLLTENEELKSLDTFYSLSCGMSVTLYNFFFFVVVLNQYRTSHVPWLILSKCIFACGK